MTQDRLCLDCHKKVDNDIRLKQGFHGKDKKVAASQCRDCHTEHEGKDAQIIILDKDAFDHDSTDFPLTGKHRQTVCENCHESDKKFRETSSKCVACHKDDDAHDNKLGEKCESCHNPKSWSSEQFDHDKTDFKLRFAHKQVACDLCHVANQYKETPKTCVSCHAIKDVHQNRFGKKCASCHSEEKWVKTHFNHFKDTGIRLKGSHQTVTCHACHGLKDSAPKGHAKFNKDNPRTCINCHRLDDVHQGKNGEDCEKCHSEDRWSKSSFNHDKDTDFRLLGAHAKASCQSCHQQDVKGQKTDSACYSCHEHQDAHAGEEGKKCNQCHNETSWLKDVRFDHDLSNFPLIGQHAVVGCESCHLDSHFKNTKSDCVDCHQQDDVHKKALGSDCMLCHNPNDWLIWQFDHDKTEFKIEGAHDGLHCNQCHNKPMEKHRETARDCIACHYQDDIHGGNFGADCARCHNQQDFKEIDIQ